MDKEQLEKILDTHNKVMDVVSESGLDGFDIVAVLSKCLINYAVHIEDRDEFNIRMAMTYDFVKSQTPPLEEMH